MNKRPIKFIIPRIHILNDYYIIQWIGYEYYIKRKKTPNYFYRNKLKILEVLLLVLLLIIGKSLPLNNIEDILRLFLLTIVSGIQSGVAIADYIDNDTK